MRYDRSSLSATIDAARKASEKDHETRYVFATAYGFIERIKNGG